MEACIPGTVMTQAAALVGQPAKHITGPSPSSMHLPTWHAYVFPLPTAATNGSPYWQVASTHS